MKPTDTVSIHVPLKAEYVSIVRLTASGIASRIGFDIDVIEDIKVSISEVISRIIDKKVSSDRIRIDFCHSGDGMRIDFSLPGEVPGDIFEDEPDNFAFAIISSLMDEVKMQSRGDILLTMAKKLEGAVS
jgi:serine/threonine-protein kinase RsbW